MAPKITLYTSHLCPWAHRSQIALRELGLEFDTVIIDLSVPRTPEYLAVNPRGLVPSLSYDGTILTESGLISQFLLDSHPSHLVKTSSEPGGALQRFQLGFFVDTYFTKAHPNLQAAITSLGEEKNAAATKYTDAIIKEVEPLLSDAAPFFGGSSRLTLAEVQTASFIIRALAFAKHEELLPKSLKTTLEAKAPNFWKWAQAVSAEKSVTAVWDEDVVINRTLKRIRDRAAAAKAQ